MANYQYDFASGGVIKVNVDQQWMEIMGGFDRDEHANNEYNRRLTIKLSHVSQHEPDPSDIVCRAESIAELMKKVGALTDRQREVLAKRYAGMSCRKIGGALGVSHTAIEKMLKVIAKKVSEDGCQTT